MSDHRAFEAERLLAVGNRLGEGPLWHPNEQALYWVDIFQQRIHRLCPASHEHQVCELDGRVTSLALRASAGLVVTTDKAFALWDPQTGNLEPLAAPEGLPAEVRFNDGAVDRMGRFWAGTMNEDNVQALDGCLYRLDADRTLHTMGSGYTISNGLGWSPDNTAMYHTDSARGVIWLYDYDHASGAIRNQRAFVQVPEHEGIPDGLAVDSQGYVWIAHWGGRKITRYDPAGRATLEVRVPAQHVTSCAFGGENLDELFITTAWHGLSEAEREAQRQAGDLFVARMGIQGIEEPRFAG